MDSASDYWDGRYSDVVGIEHHARQNEQIAQDFIRNVKNNPAFCSALKEKLVIEIGCGTGDLASKITDQLYCAVEATDLSGFAVEIAKIRFPHLIVHQYDMFRDPVIGSYEVALSSNVIEHFKDPHSFIAKMFTLAPKVVIVAPFNQVYLDGYDNEGGAGHVSTINWDTFLPYEVEEFFFFRTDGWQHSTGGEYPLQMAVLISERG